MPRANVLNCSIRLLVPYTVLYACFTLISLHLASQFTLLKQSVFFYSSPTLESEETGAAQWSQASAIVTKVISHNSSIVVDDAGVWGRERGLFVVYIVARPHMKHESGADVTQVSDDYASVHPLKKRLRLQWCP